MGFWVLQILMDVMFLAAIGIVYRKHRYLQTRLRMIEVDIRNLQKVLVSGLDIKKEMPAPSRIKEDSFEGKKTTLIESQKAEKDRSNIEVYERADTLLAKGLKLSDVSQQTGLSVSELRLIQKMNSRQH